MKTTDTNELRKIAKVFAKGLPVEGQAFGETVNRFLAEVGE